MKVISNSADIPNFSADEIEAFKNMGFAVTNVEIQALQPAMESTNGEYPPDLALAAIEYSLTVGRKQLYETFFEHGVNIDGDSVIHTWKKLNSRFKHLKYSNKLSYFIIHVTCIRELNEFNLISQRRKRHLAR